MNEEQANGPSATKQIPECLRAINQSLGDAFNSIANIHSTLDRVNSRDKEEAKKISEPKPEPKTITQALEFLKEDSRMLSQRLEYLGKRCEELF